MELEPGLPAGGVAELPPSEPAKERTEVSGRKARGRKPLPPEEKAARAKGLASGAASGNLGSASGDLSGSFPGPTVIKLQGRAVSSSTPAQGQALVWSLRISKMTGP